MTGGSAGAEKVEAQGSGGGSGIRIVGRDVPIMFLTGKQSVTGRILPARDLSYGHADPAYKTSVVPYRDLESGRQNPSDGTPAFTNWFVTVELQSFVGGTYKDGGIDYVSPITLQKMAGVTGVDAMDPVAECFFLVKRWLKEDKEKNNLSPDRRAYLERTVDRGGMRDNPMFQSPNTTSFVNVWAVDPQDGKHKNALLKLGKTAMDHLKEVLSNRTPRSMNSPHDPTWPDYLLGDITDPKIGLQFHSTQAQFPAVARPVNVLRFSNNHKEQDLTGAKPLPVSEEVLAGRFEIAGDNHVFEIPTFQEILDWMVDSGKFDLDIVKEACGAHGDMGRTERIAVPAPTKPVETPAAQTAQTTAPTATPAPQPVVADAEPQYYWVVEGGKTVKREALELSGYEGRMMKVGESAWRMASDYGFVPTPPPPPVEEPPPPPPEDLPPPPPVEEPPPPPVEAPPPPPADAPPPAQAPTGDRTEQSARLDELRTKMTTAPDSLTEAEMQELVTLTQALS
jgi:hypothetical protein